MPDHGTDLSPKSAVTACRFLTIRLRTGLHRRRVQLLLPMRQTPLQVSAQIVDRLIVGCALHHFELELLRAVRLPCLLQARGAATAHAQSEPEPVLDRFQVRVLPNPDFVRRGATQQVDPAGVCVPCMQRPPPYALP